MSDVTIKYKGATIATMDATGSKPLKTQGKYCEGDIDVEYVKPAGPTGTKQISITENGTVTEDVAAYASAEISVNVQGGGTEQPITHATVTAETDLKNFLADYPIPLKYSSEICCLRFYSDTAASTGGTANWIMFFVENLSSVGMLTNYNNSTVAANTMGEISTINTVGASYFYISNYSITNSNTTNATRKIAAGTVAKVLHIPFSWATFALDAQALSS